MRVGDTSLWKIIQNSQQAGMGKFRLCPDKGSAYYDCFATFLGNVINKKRIEKF